MSSLFQRDRSVITKHVNNVFDEGELDAASNVHFLHVANSDKPVKYYSLDVIISVGYRVKSQQGTQFRIWATQRLRDYIVKGFALNDERFKSGSSMCSHMYFSFTWFLNCFAAAPAVRPSTRAAVA